MQPGDAIERYYRAYNAHDLATMAASYGEWGSFSAPGGLTLRGRDHAGEYDRRWLEAFPDLQIDVERRTEAGATVVVEAVARGTHLGRLNVLGEEIPPTARRVEIRFCAVYAVEDGLIVTAHLQYDRLSLLRQLDSGYHLAPHG